MNAYPQVGQICRTPFEETSCPVKVLAIEGFHPAFDRQTARVLFLENSPAGYLKGSEGRYFCDELKIVEGVKLASVS